MANAVKSSVLVKKRRELVHAAKRLRRDPSPENFHVTRVATRRLRGALRVLEASHEEQARARAVAVRRLARRLGRVRDLDVLLQRVETFALDQATEGSSGLAAFSKEARSQRKRARRRVIRMLESNEFSQLKKKLRSLARRVQESREAVTEFGRSLVLAHGRGLLALDVDPATASSEDLHRFRVRIKRFRYVLELSPTSTHLSTLLLAQAKRAQDLLGVLNDAFVAEARVLAFLEAHPRYRNSLALTRLVAACRAEQERCRADLPAAITSFRAALAAFLANEENRTGHVGPRLTAVRSSEPALKRTAGN
jgi:CHAD domain-containing protein